MDCRVWSLSCFDNFRQQYATIIKDLKLYWVSKKLSTHWILNHFKRCSTIFHLLDFRFEIVAQKCICVLATKTSMTAAPSTGQIRADAFLALQRYSLFPSSPHHWDGGWVSMSLSQGHERTGRTPDRQAGSDGQQLVSATFWPSDTGNWHFKLSQ